jgi:adhesin/invasin
MVKGPDGTELCRTQVNADLTWSCPLLPAPAEGDKVTIVEEDPATNQTEKVWRIGLPRVLVNKPAITQGDPQTVVGENFQPGEVVSGVMNSDTLPLGDLVADDDGRVTFTWQVPASTNPGAHQARLTGPLSGEVVGAFNVAALAETGASDLVALAGTAAGMAVFGWWFLLLAKRRRRVDAN